MTPGDRPDYVGKVQSNVLGGQLGLIESLIKGGEWKAGVNQSIGGIWADVYTVPSGKVFYLVGANLICDNAAGSITGSADLGHQPGGTGETYTWALVRAEAGAVRNGFTGLATSFPFAEGDKLRIIAFAPNCIGFACIWGAEVPAGEAAFMLAFRDGQGYLMRVLERFNRPLYDRLRDEGVEGRFAPLGLAQRLDRQLSGPEES